ncbi:LysR family transcriptional regulator [Nannocystis punicea]|uniref:LysR substrate-binding domain-containing protein n=1 Tax=Nannocystis punicea TaxID=2995304 RepID=A0ABY7GWF0_9BACT|nr:LysR family transcriptional regulator [Nannocystis poenicansa]WAS91305.1 LysR substrate-binding domain-containing protein [Nannocystis poenicansa]
MAFTPLNSLNTFLAVARRRSFAAAATELGISPSALSQSVRQLEERLGVALLSRTTRSVALTDAGRRLFEQAGPGVEQALEALKSASAQADEVTGKVRLTVPAMAVPFVITPVLPRFVASYPKVEVEVQVEDLRRDIVAEGFDAGVRLEEYIERDMVQVRLTQASRFVVAGAPSYLKRRGTPEAPKDLLAHDCITCRSATTQALYAWELERGKKSWRIPVHGNVITNDEGLMVAMAEAGLGLIYAFEPSVQPLLKRGSLRLVLEPYAAAVPGLFLYFPNRAQVSPALRAFIDTAREVTASLRTRAPKSQD